MKTNKNQIELESKIENLPVISDFISGSLERFAVDAATVFKIQLAVDEASTNVMNYAYPGGTGPLKITLEISGEEVIITINDRGKPFDPLSLPPPELNQSADERKIGGLGIYFIRKLMDDVSYSHDPQEGNRLTFRKKLVPEKPSGPQN